MSRQETAMGQAVRGGSRSAARTAVRVVGWILLIAGAVILLYVAYLLVYTGRTTAEAQSDMLQRWEADLGGPPEAAVSPPSDATQAADSDGVAQPEDAYAAMWFERPGATGRPVTDDTLFLVHGVDPETLKRGPGHYPYTAAPGEAGNFAIAGHRTTYGAPFFDLDELERGDEVHVVDRAGSHVTYIVEREQVVEPDEVWVVDPDPLGSGEPTLTLTTCYPRFSAAQRLIVFATLAN